MNDIFNAIFYFDKKTGKKNALIIYDDGSVRLTSYEEGMMICTNYSKLKSSTSSNSDFNPNFISIISKKQLLRWYSNILPEKILDSIKNDNINGSISSSISESINVDDIYKATDKAEHVDFITLSNLDMDFNDKISSRKRHMFSFKPEERDEFLSKNPHIARQVDCDNESMIDNSNSMDDFNASSSLNDDFADSDENIDDYVDEDIINDGNIKFKYIDAHSFDELDNKVETDELDDLEKIDKLDDNRDSQTDLPKKKKTSKWIAILSFCIALGIVCSIYVLTRKRDDKNSNSTSISTSDQLSKNANHMNSSSSEELSPFKKLLNSTSSEVQKNVMSNITAFLHHFNSTFGNGYIEKGKNIKPALSFDEMISLMCAYNDYSKEDIKAIFNGADINSTEMSWNYKNASLQLMGAYIIETKNYPLELSNLIDSEEGKEFYNRYHEMFMKAKYAKGNEREKLVKDFYDCVRRDFPITDDVRTNGISHADSFDNLKSYKLSVAPMIAAAEMIFKDTEYSLDDSEIDFLNDIGLCNLADHKFERIETIVLSSDADTNNPLYNDYRNIIIKMLKDNKEYVIDDDHRDLSKLDTFNLIVNGRFDEVLNGEFICVTTYSTESYTSYYEEITRTEKDIPDDVKAEIDAEIDRENSDAKANGEAYAEENRKKIQDAENKNAERVNSEVEADTKDFEQKINDANSSSNINENDFGNHGVDFDDNYSDSNGNLDKSVDNITTDPSGDQSYDPLPDPNATGAEFDKKAIGSTGFSIDDYVDYVVDYYSSINDDEYDVGYQYVK